MKSSNPFKIKKTFREWIEYLLYLLMVVLIFFVIIFNAIYWGINQPNSIEDTLTVLISTFIPLLCSALCFFIAKYIHIWSYKDKLTMIAKMRSQGILTETSANLARKDALELEKIRRLQRINFWNDLKEIEKIVQNLDTTKITEEQINQIIEEGIENE